ncbi:MAG TPA: hypothetical protein PKD64_19500 [Pirellulaceae bacterium]|nr:hypothetical protein [Pirellulaceae bacterium]HMO94378.1 hypothetical protein [Pirellulaceae bacterium]HMP71524.1 hypothetical protein [Pirellulaceae bacterium]
MSACTTFWSIIFLIVTGLPRVFSCQDAYKDVSNVVESVLESLLDNEELLNKIDCRFSLVVGDAHNETEILSGQFSNILGTATGRWVRSNELEYHQIEVGDIFKTISVDKDGGSIVVPFPGGQVVLKNEDYVMAISPDFSTGEIGRRQTFFPDEVFNFRHCLGAVGMGKWAEPIRWYIEPPESINHTISERTNHLVFDSTMASGSIEATFDSDANFALSSFKVSQGGISGRFFVSEFSRLENGGCIPKIAHGVFTDKNVFPKRVVRWELDSVVEIENFDDINFIVPEVPWIQVWMNANHTKLTRLKGGTQVTINDLASIFECCNNQTEFVDLPSASLTGNNQSFATTTYVDGNSSSSNRFPLFFLFIFLAAIAFVVLLLLRLNRKNLKSMLLMIAVFLIGACKSPQVLARFQSQTLAGAGRQTQDDRPDEFRKLPLVVFVADYHGNVLLPQAKHLISGFSTWGSDVDLLRCDEIQQALKMSQPEIRDWKKLYEDYRNAVVELHRSETAVNWEKLQIHRDGIVDFLGRTRHQQLAKWDHYLHFRRFGAESYLQHFCREVETGNVTDLAERERVIWNDYLENYQDIWKQTVVELEALVAETELTTWQSLRDAYRNPFAGEISLIFDQAAITEIFDGSAEEIYRKSMGQSIQFEIAVDGTMTTKTYSMSINDTLGYQLTWLQHQQMTEGTNLLNITESQFAKLDQIHRDYGEKMNQLRERQIEQALAGEAEESRRFFREELKKVDQQFEESVWRDVLLPLQKELLVEDAQIRMCRLLGPLSFFYRPSMRDLPGWRDRRQSATEIIQKFEQQLADQERKFLRELFDLLTETTAAKGVRLEFKLADRPEYLRPSIIYCLIYLHD